MVYLYRTLDVDKVIATVQKLSARINDRFPNAGLNSVCAELEAIATETKHRIEWISKPNWIIRGAVGLVLVLMISVLIFTIFSLELQAAKFGIGDLVQVMEATINDFILIGAAIFFMVNLEGRMKRQRSLKVLHELRSIVHVIDMHQLTKDPSRQTENNTTNSPKIELSPAEMGRYFDYCSEMLSITGKVAALYAQAIEDSVVLQAVNEIESLTTSMSQKIWQKIMLLKQDSAQIAPEQGT